MKLILLLALLGGASFCCAQDRAAALAEIVDLAVKNQKNRLSDEHWRDHAKRFQDLMGLIANEDAKLGKDEISRLNPAILQDRIRLIALHRLQHPDLFEEIYKTYVKHPSGAEIEKMRQAFIAENPETEEQKKFNQKLNQGGGRLVRVDPRFPAPHSIKESHLAPKYRYCFEYFWMAPVHDDTMKHFENAMEMAMDHFKEKSGGVDIRDLIKVK